jgi:RHS repeat-associated protein
MRKLVSARAAAVGVVSLSMALQLAHADTQVHTKSWQYDPYSGVVTQEVVEPDNPNNCVQTTYTYDATSGVRNSVSNSACAGASGYTTSSATTARTTRLGISGNFPGSRTSPMDVTESAAYDRFARVRSETRPDTTFTNYTRRLCSYSGTNCPTSIGPAAVVWVQIEQSYAGGSGSTVNAPELRKYFDALGHVVRVQTLGFDGNGATAPVIVQDTWYDAQGRVAQTSKPYALATETPAWAIYGYDALGRITQESHPDSAAPGGTATTTYTYNGLTTSSTNSKSQTKTAIRNAQGLIAQVIDAKGASINYSYDSVGNLTQVNASGAITTLAYNQRGQKIGMVDATMGSWQYAYNAFGELVWQQDSLGHQTTLVYDLDGRLTQRNEPDLVSQWSWDTNFNGTTCGRKDKICEAKANNAYDRHHTYDVSGRILTTSLVLDNANSPALVSETYDSHTGFVTSKTWPTGFKATYTYTALGYLSGVTATDSGGTHTVSYTVLAMNSQGQVTQYRTGNNVTTVRNFDSQTNRLLGLTATANGQAQGNVLAQAYSYDSVGNLLTRADNTPGVGTQESFSYDVANRLTLASISGGALPQAQLTEVDYDDLGNITYKSDVGTYWYDTQRPSRMVNVTLDTPASAQVPLTGTRQLSYAFDDTNTGAQTVNGVTLGNGNLQYTVQQDTVNNIHTVRSETYSSFNMPQQLVYGNYVTNTTSTADRTLTFTYGPEHQRLKQNIALSGSGTSSYTSGTIYYANGIDSLGLSYERAFLTNGIKEDKHYVTAGGQVFAIFVSRSGSLGNTPATTTSYIHQDRLTSVGVVTDETGAIKERFAYDPWGKRRYTNGTIDVVDAIVGNNTRRGFTMQEHLDEVGVIHMNARIYDPLVGRFMSADSVIPNAADLKSFNRYAYLSDNPLHGMDSTGHEEYDVMPKADWGPDGVGGTNSANSYADFISENTPVAANITANDRQAVFNSNAGWSEYYPSGVPATTAEAARLSASTDAVEGFPGGSPSSTATTAGAPNTLSAGGNSGQVGGDNVGATATQPQQSVPSAGVQDATDVLNTRTALGASGTTGTNPISTQIADNSATNDTALTALAKSVNAVSNFVTAGYSTKFAQAMNDGDYASAAAYLLAGTTMGVANVFSDGAASAGARALNAADLGLQGVIKDFSGTISMEGKTAVVQVDMVQGQISNPFQVLNSLKSTASGLGADTLEIRGTIADPQLYNIFVRRYGAVSNGGSETLTIPLN